MHVVTDAKGRPIRFSGDLIPRIKSRSLELLSAGQTSDYIGARALLSSIPQAGALLADRG